MKKYDKILIAIIVLLCVAIVLSISAGAVCYSSSWYHRYGDGTFSIVAMVFSIIALIFTVITLKHKTNDRRYIFIIGTLASNCLAWIMSLCSLILDINYDEEIFYPLSSIAFISLTTTVVLASIYLKEGIKTYKNTIKAKPQIEITKVTQTTTLGIDTGANELKGLKALLDSGILTPSEFAVQKSRLLSSMGINVEKEKAEKQPSFNGNYVNENGIILTLNSDKFTIRKPNGENVLTGTYTVDHTAQCITLARDNGSTMRLQIKDENHLMDGAQQVYTKK